MVRLHDLGWSAKRLSKEFGCARNTVRRYLLIIAGEAGQRETFEELVYQIAQRDPLATALEFRRIHGAGGDGGLEAF